MVRLQVHAQFDNHASKTVKPFSLNIFYFNISHTYNIYIHNIIRIGTEAISLFNFSPYTQKKITIVMATSLSYVCFAITKSRNKPVRNFDNGCTPILQNMIVHGWTYNHEGMSYYGT